MSDYKEIKGIKVQDLSADPPAPLVGQVWYNNSSGDLKYYGDSIPASWATGGTLNTTRRLLAGAGTQTAGLAFGGTPPSTQSEDYNGTAWTVGGTMNNNRQQLGGCGIQTAALAMGGYPAPNGDFTEEYDGSSWTIGGSLNTARDGLAAAGTQTAGLAFGGVIYAIPTPAQPATGATEEYNGTAWTAGGTMGTARDFLAGAGLQTAGLAIGGFLRPGGPATAATEEYNGSAWTAGGNLGTARYLLGGDGIQTAALAFGGRTPIANEVANTESYDGSTWTATASLNLSRSMLSGAGTQTAALAFGGRDSVGDTNATEEFTGLTPAGARIIGTD